MANSKYVNFLEGLVVGGSVGAAMTFLFGTREGKKLQSKIVKQCKRLEEKAEHYLDNVKKAVKSPVAKKIKRFAKKTKRKAAHLTRRAKKRSSGRK